MSADGCLDNSNNQILKFSQKFLSKLFDLMNINYSLSKARVKYIVYWKDDNSKKELKIILPEITFVKKNGKKVD